MQNIKIIKHNYRKVFDFEIVDVCMALNKCDAYKTAYLTKLLNVFINSYIKNCNNRINSYKMH